MTNEQRTFYIGQANPSLAPTGFPRSRYSYAVGTENSVSFLGNESELYGYLKALTNTHNGVRFVARFPANHDFYNCDDAEPLRSPVLERMQGSFPHNF